MWLTNRPLPPLTDLNRAFWTGSVAGHLVIQRCTACRQWTERYTPIPPTKECPLCMHFGTGGAPASAKDAPFAVAIALFGMNSEFTTVDLRL